MTIEQGNWAGNLTYSAKGWHKPESREQLQAIIHQAQKVKVLGTRHSFNNIADTPHDMIDLSGWNRILELDPIQQAVTVEPGVRYGELALYLDQAGFALHNMASLPHISVAGAIATATHGSGVNNRNLAGAVTALEIMTADGEMLIFDAEQHTGRFAAAVVNLGAIGVVTRITLRIEPAYNMRQNLYLNLPFSALETHFDAIMASGYSVSLFTDWQTDQFNQVWVKQHIPESSIGLDTPDLFFGARPATVPLHPIASISPESCTEQMGLVGRWHQRLPHFRLDFVPSHGDELQTEYFVAYENALEALNLVREIRDQITPNLLTSEIRTIATDHLWMSPSYQQDTVALHLTWKMDVEAVGQAINRLEKQLMPLNIRPHWGKLFSLPAVYLREQYPRWDDFVAFMQDIDPAGKFRNPFIDHVFFR